MASREQPDGPPSADGSWERPAVGSTLPIEIFGVAGAGAGVARSDGVAEAPAPTVGIGAAVGVVATGARVTVTTVVGIERAAGTPAVAGRITTRTVRATAVTPMAVHPSQMSG